METEEFRIVDLIVNFERRLDSSRFTVDRERRFGRLERVASGYIEVETPGALPQITLDRPAMQLTEQLTHWIRVRWTGLQRQMREGQASEISNGSASSEQA